jgi:hypothetical protein
MNLSNSNQNLYGNSGQVRNNENYSPGKAYKQEGTVAKAIEQQTIKIPSDVFLWSAVGAMAAGFFLEVTGREEKAHWIGQWVAPILLLGVYNKIVKVSGS